MDDHDSLAIEVQGLHRRYGDGAGAFEAVRGLDLAVRRGTVHALLGVNGAGKTSTMEVIEGLAAATAGRVRVLGLDPLADRARVRRRTGVLLQRSGFVNDLSVGETLAMWAATLTDPRPLAESLDLLDLARLEHAPMRALSGGEQRRVDLACALMGRPEVVMLDEPTTGLDPESRRSVWDLVRSLRERGSTVLLTTHYLEEAEALADRVSIMAEGRIVREGTVAELVAAHPAEIGFLTPHQSLPELAGVQRHDREGRTRLVVRDLQPALTELLAWAARDAVRLDDLSARSATLEAVFLAVAQAHPARKDDAAPTGARALDRSHR